MNMFLNFESEFDTAMQIDPSLMDGLQYSICSIHEHIQRCGNQIGEDEWKTRAEGKYLEVFSSCQPPVHEQGAGDMSTRVQIHMKRWWAQCQTIPIVSHCPRLLSLSCHLKPCPAVTPVFLTIPHQPTSTAHPFPPPLSHIHMYHPT